MHHGDDFLDIYLSGMFDKKVTFGKGAKDCYIAKLAPKFE